MDERPTTELTPTSPKKGRVAKRFLSHLHFAHSWTDAIADFLTQQFGTVWFFVFNAAFFIGWIEWNLGWFGLPIFDPFPFGLLTMIVSLEAIFLAIIVLISQNRLGKIADVRDKMDLEIDVRAEAEITKILRILDGLQHHLGVSKEDRELRWMEHYTDIREIQERIERESDY